MGSFARDEISECPFVFHACCRYNKLRIYKARKSKSHHYAIINNENYYEVVFNSPYSEFCIFLRLHNMNRQPVRFVSLHYCIVLHPLYFSARIVLRNNME